MAYQSNRKNNENQDTDVSDIDKDELLENP